MKHLYSSLLVILIVTGSLLVGCKTTPPPVSQTMRFDFKPIEQSEPKQVNIALVRPRFVNSFKQANEDPFKTFASNMETDFLEMITSRGYTYIGPFGTYDEMVYADKKGTDLILEVELDFQVAGQPLRSQEITWPTVYTIYWYDGEVTLSGKLTYYLSEPFTKTKVMVKSIAMESKTFLLKSYEKYKGPNIPHTDPYVWNSLIEILEPAYNNMLQNSWRYLEPEELTVKKAEANEIKQNSGFIKN